MKKENFLTGAVIILFVLNLMTLAYVLFGFQPMPPPPEETGKHRLPERKDEMIINKLKLDEEQKKLFEVLKTEHRKLADSLQNASKKLHDDYFGILKSEPVDTAKANIIVQKIADNQKELDKITFRHFEKLRGILKNEQKENFSRFIEEVSRPPKGDKPMDGPPG